MHRVDVVVGDVESLEVTEMREGGETGEFVRRDVETSHRHWQSRQERQLVPSAAFIESVREREATRDNSQIGFHEIR